MEKHTQQHREENTRRNYYAKKKKKFLLCSDKRESVAFCSTKGMEEGSLVWGKK